MVKKEIKILFYVKFLKYLFDNLFTRLSRFTIFSGFVITIFSKFVNPLSYSETFLLYSYIIIAIIYDVSESIKTLLSTDKEAIFKEIKRIKEGNND